MIRPIDWLFYFGAGALAVLGLWLLYWSLLHDRSRGRRRCPKCWYDMSGTPGSLTCSECGKVARRERRLFRTRRRWRWACMAVLVLLLATGSALTPKLRRGEWASLVPTTFMVLAMPTLERWSPTLATELQGRFDAGRLWDWQISILFRRCVNVSNPPWTVQVLTRATWPAGTEARYILHMDRQPSTIVWVDGLRLRLRATPRNPGSTVTVLISSQQISPTPLTAWRFATAGAPGTPAAPRRLMNIFTCQWVDADKGISYDAANWKSRGGSIGSLNADINQVVFDLELECEHLVPGRGRVWTNMWSGEKVVPMQVRGTVAAALRPISSPAIDEIIRSRLWAMGMDNVLRVVRTFGPIPELGEHAAIGAVFEVLHDGQVVARTSGWWGNNDAPRLSEVLSWEWQDDEVKSFRGVSPGDWSLRVRSDPRLALLAFDDCAATDPDATTYWEGQVTIPLRIGRPSGYLIPQREPVPEGLWGWTSSRTSTQRD